VGFVDDDDRVFETKSCAFSGAAVQQRLVRQDDQLAERNSTPARSSRKKADNFSQRALG